MLSNLDAGSVLNKYFKIKIENLTSTSTSTSTKKKNKSEANRVLEKYPDRVPVLVTKNQYSSTTPDIDKQKFLVPVDITMGQLLYVIRKRLQLHPEKGLFLFIDGNMISNHELVGIVYQQSHDREDCFLHVVYGCESVFGGT